MASVLNLDESFDTISKEDLDFIKTQTGILNDQELKTHVISVAEKAYKVFPFGCITRFLFLNGRMSHHFGYKRALELCSAQPGAILMDIGCCMGTDVRKLAADGVPFQNIIATDLRAEYWDLGHELFKSSPTSFPVPFVSADVLGPSLISDVESLLAETTTPASEANTLDYHRNISVIHLSCLFHLFDEETQPRLIERLVALLSSRPGSMIFGQEVGLERTGKLPFQIRERDVYCHSPESWKALWEGLFPGKVEVEAVLESTSLPEEGLGLWLNWCVIRK
ncbi:hypothetical protein E1B28_007612 [Marasmius oreades]|uniref:Methyltransferase domain-containing protein n=1 Tax=Marasmius oreades TaxID=181124 RepID=A0A9P7S2Q0_9AGAR|nr:uncharacterized protein E1B28_007612 [Marasmius oreades]KAG7093982.1 hypothetical protein E1B28_007612 [Marasmius oreades]